FSRASNEKAHSKRRRAVLEGRRQLDFGLGRSRKLWRYSRGHFRKGTLSPKGCGPCSPGQRQAFCAIRRGFAAQRREALTDGSGRIAERQLCILWHWRFSCPGEH